MEFSIAIIEDDLDLVALYRETFEYINSEKMLRCHYFTNAEDALAVIMNQRFDLIISDLKLPNMSGIELIQKLRVESANQNSLIYIVSGFVDEDTRSLAFDLKDIKVFEKPIDNLIEFANNCLEMLKTRKELNYDPVLLDLIRMAAQNLLLTYFEKKPVIGRCQLTPLNTSPQSIRGFISFAGEGFNGTLAVDLGEGFVEKFNTRVDLAAPLSRPDIAYELANQLAGQFKTLVNSNGYKLDIGVPQMLTLQEVEKLRPIDHAIVYIPAGYIGSLFRIEFTMTEPDFTNIKPDHSINIVNDGQVLLFD